MRSAAPLPIVATRFSCRDQDHRLALQSLFSGKLPRADRHHLGLRRHLDAVLPDGRAAARRVDETASRRAPSGVALRDWQTGWKGSLGRKAAPTNALKPLHHNGCDFRSSCQTCKMCCRLFGTARGCWHVVTGKMSSHGPTWTSGEVWY